MMEILSFSLFIMSIGVLLIGIGFIIEVSKKK